MSTTIQEICESIPQLDEGGRFTSAQAQVRGERVPTVVDGLKAKRPPVTEGLHTFTPAELLTLRVPKLEVNHAIHGYQRDDDRRHARRIAKSMLEGRRIPEIKVAVDGKGVLWVVDGQHRSMGAVIAGKPLRAVVERLSKEEQAQLFADQRRAKPVDRNVLILAGNGPYERYIQTACTDNRHPWTEIVSANPRSNTRISPYSALGLLTSYVGNAVGTRITSSMVERWDESLADELAPLIQCFGNKQTNPPAFRAAALNGIGQTAMHVFRRNEHAQSGDHERWVVHMAKFPWERYMHVRTAADFNFHLVQHWNKRLNQSRKVQI